MRLRNKPKRGAPTYDAPDKPHRAITPESVEQFDAGLLEELREQVRKKLITEEDAAALARRCALPW